LINNNNNKSHLKIPLRA